MFGLRFVSLLIQVSQMGQPDLFVEKIQWRW